MKPILSSLLFFTLLYLISDIFVKQSSFGIFTQTIHLTLFGDEEQFVDPITQSSFLEFWHGEIFFIMMIVFTLSTIFIRVSNASKSAIVIVNLLMISSIISLISLPLAYFIHVGFIQIYVLTFFVWHILSILSALTSLKGLYYA